MLRREARRGRIVVRFQIHRRVLELVDGSARWGNAGDIPVAVIAVANRSRVGQRLRGDPACQVVGEADVPQERILNGRQFVLAVVAQRGDAPVHSSPLRDRCEAS